MLQVLTSRVHHSQVTAERSAQLSAQRADYVATGRQADHVYARSIALIEWDGPAVAVRNGDHYDVWEV